MLIMTIIWKLYYLWLLYFSNNKMELAIYFKETIAFNMISGFNG